MNAYAALRGFSRRRRALADTDERCDLCGLAVGTEHPHVLEIANGRILCACDPCAILFTHRDKDRKLVRIPRDARRLNDFDINDADWNALRLPIDLAFFVYKSAAGQVKAYYPSPAGNVECLLPLEAWNQVPQMQPDVEALLVDRTRGNRRYFIAPIDLCYKLTGLIRKQWRGFSGGDVVWRVVDRFFDQLEQCDA